MNQREPVLIVGVDAAVAIKKTGVVSGRFDDGKLHVDRCLSAAPGPIAQHILQERAPTKPYLVCIDAPLGWPLSLGASLGQHRAGAGLAGDANTLFRRATDRFIKEKTGQQPLDVGADRIARTAHAALKFLDELRRLTGEEIPLAWSSDLTGGGGVCIEVYPAATLRAHGLPFRGYKKLSGQSALVRAQVLDSIAGNMDAGVRRAALDNEHVFDAVICVVAGADFLRGNCHAPTDGASARREGWIWVRSAGP